MSDALILEFAGVTPDQYHEVNKALNIDQENGEGDWPEGMESHTGAAGAEGSLVVFEVWASKEAQEAFMNSRLGPALGQVGVPDPTRVEWLTVLGTHNP